MNSKESNSMYALLPVVHQMRDADKGDILRGLLGVVQQQANAVENNIRQGYRDSFIETCRKRVENNKINCCFSGIKLNFRFLTYVIHEIKVLYTERLLIQQAVIAWIFWFLLIFHIFTKVWGFTNR